METTTKVSQTAEWHDWVGELFEPAFAATIEDLVAHEEEPRNKPRIKHVSVYDPDAIRKVYEKVHMMTVLEEEMKKEQQRRKSSPVSAMKPKVEYASASVQDKRTDSVQGQVTVDLNQSCIWDSGEIAILREAYKTLKQQSIDAMIHVRETLKRNDDLEKLTVEQQKIIDSQKLKLSEMRNANKRLQIHVTSLKEEVNYLTAKAGAMEDVIKEVKVEHSNMAQELLDNHVSTDKERMERERIQMKLDSLNKTATAEKLAAEDKIRTQCQKAIHDLKEQIKQLEKQLLEEKNRRIITEKGLKHLRTHFSSLAVQDIMPQNAVVKDQLSHVQY